MKKYNISKTELLIFLAFSLYIFAQVSRIFI